MKKTRNAEQGARCIPRSSSTGCSITSSSEAVHTAEKSGTSTVPVKFLHATSILVHLASTPLGTLSSVHSLNFIFLNFFDLLIGNARKINLT
jgi:hypothetical protein